MKFKIMIIMTISLILLSGWYLSIFIYAASSEVSKDLVVAKGTDISNIIKYDNYLVVTNTVDINTPGEYHITYRNISDNSEITKNVYVIGDEKCNFFYNVDFVESIVSGSYEVMDTINHNGLKGVMNLKIDGLYGNNLFYFYNTKKGIETLNISRSSDIKLNDMESYKNTVVMTGYEKNSMNGDYNIVVYKEENNSISHIEIESEGFDEGNQIALNELYYFVGGQTELTNNTFTGKRSGKDSYIMVIDRLTSEIENVTMLPVEGDDNIVDLKCLDNYLYVLQNCNNSSLRLLKMDVFGNVISEKSLPLTYGVKNAEFSVHNNELYLKYAYYKYDYLDYVDTIKKVNNNLELFDFFEYYDSLLEMKFFELTDDLLKVVYQNKRGTTGMTYRIFKDQEIIGSYYKDTGGYSVGFSDNQIIDIAKDKNIFRGYTINSLYLESDSISEFSPRMTDEEIEEGLNSYCFYINGDRTTHDDSSNLTFDVNLFGDYKILYHFNDVFDFYYQKNIKVLPYGQVENGQTYDLGVAVSGNGQVFLNNELIDTPYKITEVGTYQLKIIGKDNLEALINFKVDNISQEIETNKSNESDDIVIDSINSANEYDITIPVEKQEDVDTHKSTPNVLYLIPLIAGSVGFIIIRKGI